MSYVLDALKKSERERQQGSPPHVLSVHAEPGFRRRRESRKYFVIGGVVGLVTFVLCLGGFAFYTMIKKEIAQQLQSAVVVPPDTGIQEGSRDSVAVVGDQQIVPIQSVSPVNITAESKKVLLQDTEKPRVEAEEVVSAALENDGIPLFDDLSGELKKEIPELSFSGHTYSSNPEKRLIIVNNKILREGDSIDALTTLKEITWDGIVVDFGGVVFRLENK